MKLYRSLLSFCFKGGFAVVEAKRPAEYPVELVKVGKAKGRMKKINTW